MLNDERRLPHLQDEQGREVVAPYLIRRDGLNRSIPNVCLKVPTGGGKTLLATACVERVQIDFFKQQMGFVLWVVPSDAIYRQTWKQLANREHPYRQMLERTSGGRVKLMEKGDAFTKQDVDSYLCVMLLMLPSASRQSKETLRMFRDSGRFTTFFPPEDDADLNKSLLEAVPNLDTNDIADLGYEHGVTPGWCSLKQSLGNVLRLVRPVVVIDEGHKAYSETARNTIDGFNPRFILELSATPNAGGRHSSNVLVSVPGTSLKAESMIKLPINVTNEDIFRMMQWRCVPMHPEGGCPGHSSSRDDDEKKAECLYATSCPKCGDGVYFLHHNGGCTWLDDIPYPWPKHGCFLDQSDPITGVMAATGCHTREGNYCSPSQSLGNGPDRHTDTG